MPPQIRRMKLKICVVGDRAVGKTSLVQRYVLNTFERAYRGTLGAELQQLQFRRRMMADELVEANVALFDLMGEHGIRDRFRDALYYGTHGFLAVADLTRRDTLSSLEDWVRSVLAVSGEIPYRVLFNKADLGADNVDAYRLWMDKHLPGVGHTVTSAKAGHQVGPAFDMLMKDAVGAVLARAGARRASPVAPSRILRFAARRGLRGVTKHELLAALRGVDYNAVMDEVADLERLGLVTTDEIGPANFRVRITEKGRAAAETAPLGAPAAARQIEEPLPQYVPAKERVLAALLVGRDGTMIGSRRVEQTLGIDEDIFAGALTVLRNFMTQSFPLLGQQDLRTVTLGEVTMMMEPGEHACLVLIVRGEEDHLTRGVMQETLEEFEGKNAAALGRRKGILGEIDTAPFLDRFVARGVARADQVVPG